MDWHALITRRRRPDAALILVVEDDVHVRELWTRILEDCGHDVRAVEDALSALPVLADAPHVAVCDVHLPGASGLWLIEQIRAISPTTGIVLATGDSHIPAVQSLRPGIVSYLVKPFEIEDMVKAVEEGVRWSAMRRADRRRNVR